MEIFKVKKILVAISALGSRNLMGFAADEHVRHKFTAIERSQLAVQQNPHPNCAYCLLPSVTTASTPSNQYSVTCSVKISDVNVNAALILNINP